ncbi:MAG: phosphomevalonate kinase [Phylliscum demangeonii]|nr:MAG: phosphomevalonate kinase [Phylliscum demangeonii]
MTRGPPVTISAPGKVLLTGGYLVLDRQYTGLVYGLDARIHVHIQKDENEDEKAPIVTVQSPQFVSASWTYRPRLVGDGPAVDYENLTPPERSVNAFVQTALVYASSYVSSLGVFRLGSVSITILADTDYYSRPAASTRSPSSQSDHGRFYDFQIPLQEAHKTGLGSSAALVTAMVAAVLAFYLPATTFDLSYQHGKATVHNLAQAAHCAAQGKVGSGFDVAAAVYGSGLYQRFSPSVLETLGDTGSPDFGQRLKSLVEDVERWDSRMVADSVRLPRRMRLVMCDVDGGSQTVGMAKQVLGWRKEHRSQAGLLWGQLHEKNNDLLAGLNQMAKLGAADAREYDRLVDGVVGGEDPASSSPMHPWWRDWDRLGETFTDIRRLIRRMGTAADVPIEPSSQTELLDACSAIPGVVGGVVPGAGGFDAIALLVIDDDRVLDRLDVLLRDWDLQPAAQGNEAGPRSKVQRLGVREELDGVRLEPRGQYAGWIS